MNAPENDKKSWHEDLPFPKHWLGYVVLKILVAVVAVLLVLHFSELL